MPHPIFTLYAAATSHFKSEKFNAPIGYQIPKKIIWETFYSKTPVQKIHLS